MRLTICCCLLAGLLAGCSKHDEQKPAAPQPSAATSSLAPPALTITNRLSTTPPPPATSKIERGIQVKGAGNLYLSFPATWQDQLARVPEKGRMFDSVIFLPRTNGDFQAMIEINNVGQTNADRLDTKAFLEKVGQSDLTNSVERALDIHSFQGPHMTASYFVLTDKNRFAAPSVKGDFLYLMQGCAKIDGLVISFHLACNRLPPVQDDMLEMLKSMRFEKQ